jgi:hypothetical protein
LLAPKKIDAQAEDDQEDVPQVIAVEESDSKT